MDVDKTKSIEKKEEGNEAFKKGDYIHSLLCYTIAIQYDRNNASLWGNRASAYHNLGLYDKAIEDSNYSIELQPTNSRFYWRKGQAHLALGQNYAAKLAFQNGLKHDTGSDQLRNALAERKPGEPAYKGQYANLSWEQKRDKSLEFKNAGNKFFQQKRYKEAIDEYSKAIELEPSDSIFYNNRAACYTEVNKYAEALKDTQYAVVLGKTNGVCCSGNTINAEPRLIAKAYMRMGVAEEKLGHPQKAVDAYEKGLKEEDSEPLRKMLAETRKKC